MTESSATLCSETNSIYKPGSVGIPLPKTTVKVISLDNFKEVKYNEEGELCFNTPSLMMEYYKNQQATEDVFLVDSDGMRWLRTGDLGCVDEDGFVYIKGRLKRIYITRDIDGTAYKLFPKKIEELFNKHPDVQITGVIVVEDEQRINVAVAFVKVKDSAKNIVQTLGKLAKDNLSQYEQPIAIIEIGQMPMTQSGKIDYKRLENRFCGSN